MEKHPGEKWEKWENGKNGKRREKFYDTGNQK
jgi:hypothetical protein